MQENGLLMRMLLGFWCTWFACSCSWAGWLVSVKHDGHPRRLPGYCVVESCRRRSFAMFPSIASSSRRTGLTWRTGLRRSHINYTLRTIRFDRYGRYMRTSNIHSCLQWLFSIMYLQPVLKAKSPATHKSISKEPKLWVNPTRPLRPGDGTASPSCF